MVGGGGGEGHFLYRTVQGCAAGIGVLFRLYDIKEGSRKRIYYKHLLFSSSNQETSKSSMTFQKQLSPESRP